MINLRSDTVTKPSTAMLEHLLGADNGDEYYHENRSVKALETYCATFFQKEAALFCASGIMANTLAILAQTSPEHTLISDTNYHVHYFNTYKNAALSGCDYHAVSSEDGILSPALLEKTTGTNSLKKQKLVCVENTINNLAGKIFPLSSLQNLSEFCKANNATLHLDGARLLNATFASNTKVTDYTKLVDSVIFSFSKGLGAPFGSILLGDNKLIRAAKIWMKQLGGGLHQSGLMAACALFAMKHNQSQLNIDNENAKHLGALCQAHLPNVDVSPVETNIVMLKLTDKKLNAHRFCQAASAAGLLAYPWDHDTVRMVTHMDVTKEDIHHAFDIIKSIVECKQGFLGTQRLDVNFET